MHRDIKTLNVFLDHNSNVKLGDMGVAKVTVWLLMMTMCMLLMSFCWHIASALDLKMMIKGVSCMNYV